MSTIRVLCENLTGEALIVALEAHQAELLEAASCGNGVTEKQKSAAAIKQQNYRIRKKAAEVTQVTTLPRVTEEKKKSLHTSKEKTTPLSEPSVPLSPSKKSNRKTQLAEDAQPDEQDFKIAERVGMDRQTMRVEWAAFRDHHRARGNLMADWHAAWGTWTRNWAKGAFQPRAGPPARPHRRNNGLQIAREANAERSHHQPEHSHAPAADDAGDEVWARYAQPSPPSGRARDLLDS